MDRRRQLGNVAFGGDWSEAILPREQMQAALEVLRLACAYCREVDPRTAEVREALGLIRRLTRGDMLADAFWRAGGIAVPELRLAEMQRCLRLIVSAAGKSVGG